MSKWITHKQTRHIWILHAESFSMVAQDFSQPSRIFEKLICCVFTLGVQSSCSTEHAFGHKFINKTKGLAKIRDPRWKPPEKSHQITFFTPSIVTLCQFLMTLQILEPSKSTICTLVGEGCVICDEFRMDPQFDELLHRDYVQGVRSNIVICISVLHMSYFVLHTNMIYM